MAKGRTLWEMLRGVQNGVDPPSNGLVYNPLNASPGDHVSLDVLDHRDDLWQVELSSWIEQKLGSSAIHNMADYILASGGKRKLLKVVPAGSKDCTVLLMDQYYPEDWGPMPYGEEVQLILEALDDKTGEFYRYRGEENEEKYWRIGGKVPIHAIRWDLDHTPYTIWDFWRKTLDEGGTEFTQFLYAHLRGNYVSPKKIEGGDRTLVMYRGFEIEPTKVTIYGREK